MMLHQDFVNMIVAALPQEVRELVKQHGPHLLVAGGFGRDVMTGAEPKDIDIFSTSKEVMEAAVSYFDWTDHYTARLTSNAKSFIQDDEGGPDVQFISRVFFEEHYEAIRSFDFSICQVGVYYEPDIVWQGICTPEYMEDLPKFEMRYMAPERDEDAGANVLRMVKFVSRGFKISEADIARVIGRFVANLQTTSQFPLAVEDQATEAVKVAFRRIGYAGKQDLTPVVEDPRDDADLKLDTIRENEDVPF